MRVEPEREPIISPKVTGKQVDLEKFKAHLAWLEGFPENRRRLITPIRVRFDRALMDDLANYDVLGNEITAGGLMIALTDESQKAVLTHEKTHAMFSELSEAEQRQLIAAAVARPQALNHVYQLLRTIYDVGYFSESTAITRRYRSALVGKDRAIHMSHLSTGMDFEYVDTGEVVNETLAYFNSISSAEDFIGLGSIMERIHVPAAEFVDSFDENAKDLLAEKGFFTVDVNREFAMLHADRFFTETSRAFRMMSVGLVSVK